MFTSKYFGLRPEPKHWPPSSGIRNKEIPNIDVIIGAVIFLSISEICSAPFCIIGFHDKQIIVV